MSLAARSYRVVLSSFLALYLCLKSPCNILGQSHPQLGITSSPDFKCHYFSWFRTFKFPEITLFQSSKQLRQKCFLAFYQCIKSLFKVTEYVTSLLGTKSPQVDVTLAQP